MTTKERFLTAISGGKPDRVPVTPDISNYIPCKRTGLPFWDIYFHGNIPLWQAYLDAADYYGIDPWIASCTGAPFVYAESAARVVHSFAFDAAADAVTRTTVYSSPDGVLTGRDLCFRADPPSPIEKPVKDLATQLDLFKGFARKPASLDMQTWNNMRLACAERNCAFGVCISYPGFQNWNWFVQDGIATLTYAEMDQPQLLEAWHEYDLERGTAEMELILEGQPDYVLFGGSGTITLSSPGLARKYALPALKLWSHMAKEAGVPTLLHSCGKSLILIDMLVEETDVNCINPLEIAPMGDVDLAEVKRAYGNRIALMGNLHTTSVMLRGTPRDVRLAAAKAIDDAAAGGGFVLSTGDQCERETPDENLFALVEAAKEYGTYS